EGAAEVGGEDGDTGDVGDLDEAPVDDAVAGAEGGVEGAVAPDERDPATGPGVAPADDGEVFADGVGVAVVGPPRGREGVGGGHRRSARRVTRFLPTTGSSEEMG